MHMLTCLGVCGARLGALVRSGQTRGRAVRDTAHAVGVQLSSCLPHPYALCRPPAATRAGSPEAARQINDSFARHLWMVYGSKRIGRALIHFTRGSDAGMFAEGG